MKKMFVLLLALLLCLPAAFVLTEKAEAAKRETFASGDYEYALLDDGTAEITGYSGKAESLENLLRAGWKKRHRHRGQGIL